MKLLIKQILREGLSSQDIDSMLNQLKSITNCDCCKYFNMDDLSMYGGMEHPIYYMLSKGLVFELEYISPKQYLYKIARGFGVSYDDVLGGAYIDDKAKKYANDMKSGSKFPIGYYVDGKSNQEGRHRAVATMMLGCKLIPVIKQIEVSGDYVRNFVEKYKDYSRDELDSLFKDKGYDGISSLDWREFQNYINYRL
jgi:hypothetical protein